MHYTYCLFLIMPLQSYTLFSKSSKVNRNKDNFFRYYPRIWLEGLYETVKKEPSA